MSQNHKVFVKRDELKTIGLHPTSLELYDLMHLVSCTHAIKRWKDSWSFCPVCMTMMDEDGLIRHRDRKDILV